MKEKHKTFTRFRRYERNPIIENKDIPYVSNTVFNPGACKFKDEILLLLRVEDREGISHLTIARSKDGFVFTVDDGPFMESGKEGDFKIYEAYGIEDPRITQFSDGIYYIMYTAHSPYGPRLGIAKTKDFKSVERIGIVSETSNKDGALFSDKIKGEYVRIDRPDDENIWVSYSPDLKYWGKSRVLLGPKSGEWDAHKIGGGPPPIKTEKGWLLIYHGVRMTASGGLYRVGVGLLDLENPEKVLGVSGGFLLGPKEHYERVGDVGNVVFPCGAIIEHDKVKLYYGAADSCICVATASLSDLIKTCLEN